jgi:hypothetical protein
MEVSLAHLVREVNVQPIHLGCNSHGHKFRFLLLFQNKNPSMDSFQRISQILGFIISAHLFKGILCFELKNTS